MSVNDDLWNAVMGQDYNKVKSLLKAGAEVDVRSDDMETPLIFASTDYSDEWFEIVKILVEHGADVNAEDNHAHTPLIEACYGGNYEVAEFLIDKGADVNKKSKRDDGLIITPLIMARHRDEQAIIRLLLKNGALDG